MKCKVELQVVLYISLEVNTKHIDHKEAIEKAVEMTKKKYKKEKVVSIRLYNREYKTL